MFPIRSLRRAPLPPGTVEPQPNLILMTNDEITRWIDQHGVYHAKAVALIGGSRYGGGVGEVTERRVLLRRALKDNGSLLYGSGNLSPEAMTAAAARG